MLDMLYGFQDYKIMDEGSWVIEQYQDQELIYICHLLKDGSASVFVETREHFPRLVDAYEVVSVKAAGKASAEEE